MQITNTSAGPLDLPGGQRLLPKAPTVVPNWSELAANVIIAAWVKAGVLKVEPVQAPLPRKARKRFFAGYGSKDDVTSTDALQSEESPQDNPEQ